MVLEARGIARRKAGGGRWEVEIAPGRWVPEEEAPAMTRPALPSNPPGSIERRFVEPEPRATPREREAWALCAPPPEGQGRYWADAAPLMGLTTGQQVKNLLIGYMASERIKGEPPGRMPDDERQRRAAAGRALRATTSAAEGLPAPAAGPSSTAPQRPDDVDVAPAPGTPSLGAGDVEPTHAIAIVEIGPDGTVFALDPVARPAEEVPASGGMAPASSADQLRDGEGASAAATPSPAPGSAAPRVAPRVPARTTDLVGAATARALELLDAEVERLGDVTWRLDEEIRERIAEQQRLQPLLAAATAARDAYRAHLGGDA